VAGAGIIGASIAWRLAQAGAAVTLLDAGAVGGEASWAGAGMLAPGGEIAGSTAWARLGLESLGLYADFVAELHDASGLTIDYRRSGAIEIARTEVEWAELLARQRAQAELGIKATPSGDKTLWYPDDGMVDPRHVMRALRVVCEERGVRIREQTPVTEIRLAARGVEVIFGGERLSAGAGVLAAGAWSGPIPVFEAGRRIDIPQSLPIRGHLLGYRLEPGSLGPILRHGHTYVMQRSNGYTIAGSSSEEAGFDRALNPAVIEDIRERACDLLPMLRFAAPPDAWLGFRPATPDFEPHIERLAGLPLWLAYGHYRNGILLAPVTARRISREILSSSETGSASSYGTR
jgi:glycine oxidase